MAIGTDILIDYNNQRIYQLDAYDKETDTVYTAKELYTYLMSVFDDQAQMDNKIPMSAQTPNAFTMINGWFIDDETVKWFKDGAIETANWTHPTNPTGIRLLIATDLSLLEVGDIGGVVSGAVGGTGKLLAYNTTRKALWVRCDGTDDTFQTLETITVAGHSCGALTVASTTGENLYVNLYTLGTLTSVDDTIYILQADEKIPAWWDTGITGCDVLIKVKELGVPIDSGNVIVFTRYYPSAGNAAVYDHFPITLTAGRQAVPLSTALDLNNTTAQATVAAYGITFNTGGGPYSHDLIPDTFKDYDVEVLCNNKTVAQVYEFLKYVTREGSTTQLFSDNGEEYVSANVAYPVVKVSPFGTFAGGKFFGAKGIWIQGYVAADAQKFQLTSSDGTVIDPPNTVTCQVSSLVSGYNVGMYMTDVNGVIETTTYTLDGEHGAASTTVLVTALISGNWSGQRPPPAGYLRVVLANGTEVLKKYISWITKTFTLDGTLGILCATGSKVYIPIIDEACSGTTISNTLIKAATIYVKVRVRHYAAPPNGIIPFEQDTQVGATGVDVPAIKVIDSIVN